MGFTLPKEDVALLAGLALFAYGFLTGNADAEAAGIAVAFGGKALGSVGFSATGSGSTA